MTAAMVKKKGVIIINGRDKEEILFPLFASCAYVPMCQDQFPVILLEEKIDD